MGKQQMYLYNIIKLCLPMLVILPGECHCSVIKCTRIFSRPLPCIASNEKCANSRAHRSWLRMGCVIMHIKKYNGSSHQRNAMHHCSHVLLLTLLWCVLRCETPKLNFVFVLFRVCLGRIQFVSIMDRGTISSVCNEINGNVDESEDTILHKKHV